MEDILTGKGMVIDGMRHLSPGETLDTIRFSAVLVDVRPLGLIAMKAFDVDGIIYYPLHDFKNHFKYILHDKIV